MRDPLFLSSWRVAGGAGLGLGGGTEAAGLIVTIGFAGVFAAAVGFCVGFRATGGAGAAGLGGAGVG